MIKSFKCKETERLFHYQQSIRFKAFERVALRKLLFLHRAKVLQDLANPPSNNLESLKKDRLGQHSIQINDQWRICFVWNDGNAFDVEVVDYH